MSMEDSSVIRCNLNQSPWEVMDFESHLSTAQDYQGKDDEDVTESWTREEGSISNVEWLGTNLTKKGKGTVNSTDGAPSAFGYVQTLEDKQTQSVKRNKPVKQHSVKRKIVTRGSLRKGVEPVVQMQNVETEADLCKGSGSFYLCDLPKYMWNFITDIYEVLGDGNCGYRAVAHQMGLYNVDDWKTVKRDLMNELAENRQHYLAIFGEDGVSKFSKGLTCFDSPCHKDNWMAMPIAGYMVASKYKVVFVLISNEQNLTFLPLRGAPTTQHRLISVGIVKNSHYVSVFLQPGAPLPNIASSWTYFTTEETHAWQIPYLDRIQRFRAINHDATATQNAVAVDILDN